MTLVLCSHDLQLEVLEPKACSACNSCAFSKACGFQELGACYTVRIVVCSIQGSIFGHSCVATNYHIDKTSLSVSLLPGRSGREIWLSQMHFVLLRQVFHLVILPFCCLLPASVVTDFSAVGVTLALLVSFLSFVFCGMLSAWIF